MQLNAIKLNDPGIIRADNRSSRTNKRSSISCAYTYPILRKLCAQVYSNLFLCTFHEIIARNIFQSERDRAQVNLDWNCDEFLKINSSQAGGKGKRGTAGVCIDEKR